MHTWRILLILLTLWPLLACGERGGQAEAPPQAEARPNLLLLTVDSLRADRVGYAGYAGAVTPNMDSLAARGVVFRRALAPVPQAIPSLVSLHTGRYPASHGVRTPRGLALSPDSSTLAEALKAIGYRTGASVGALLLHEKYGLSQGFDAYLAAFDDAPRPSEIMETGLVAETVVEKALEFLQTARGGPFFLWVNFFDPHYFYLPPEPYATDFAANLYDGEVAYVDRQLGRLLDKLTDYGIANRTMVVLAGTNGEGLGDNGEDYHGTTLQEATVRVPLVIVSPAWPAGSHRDAPVSLVDVAPTLQEIMGFPPLEAIEGLSLVQPPDPDRPIYLETILPQRLFGWAPLTGVVSGDWKYVAGARPELYNIDSDPGERQDMALSRPDVFDNLSAAVASYSAKTAASSRPDAQVLDDIRSLGYVTETAPRQMKDPRDMVAVANDLFKADRSFRRKQYAAASFLIEGVLREDPENCLALLDRALLARGPDRHSERRRWLERAQAQCPHDAEPYHQLGHLVLGEQGPDGADRANQLFEIASRLDPKNEEALYDLACGHAAQDRPDAALGALEMAVREGFRDFKWMARDPDLNGIRSDPRFETITGGKADLPPDDASSGSK